jgi:uncharacterized surface protein with fasciclin (FAS1) repeats
MGCENTTDRTTATVVVCCVLLGIGHVAGQVCSEIKDPISASITNRDEFSTLIVALESAGLGSVLSSPYGGPAGDAVVLLAPNDDAFDTLAQSLGIDVSQLVAEPGVIQPLLEYHVIPSGDCQGRLSGERGTLQGGAVTFAGNTVTDANGNTANVIEVVEAGNGAVLVVDSVLLPASV